MMIDQVNLYHLRMPLQTPFQTSFGSISHRECILLEIFSEDLRAYGECVADSNPGYSYETVQTAWHILGDYLIPAILGKKIKAPNELPNTFNFVRGHPMAKAGLEMAFWDLFGKQEGKSLKTLIGGVRNKVEVGVSVGIQDSSARLIEVVRAYLGQGYSRIKIKIKPGRDVLDAQALRREFPQVRLQVDANSAYTLNTARNLLPLDELNLLMIEQPLDEDDLWDHSLLQKEFKTPFCLDESIVSPRHARQAIEMGACKIINIKAGRVGGISNAILIHDFCLQNDIPVWCGGMLETGVGRAANLALASLPGFVLPGDISATERYYHQDITNEQFELSPDSTLPVPDQAGLGVTIQPDALLRYTLHHHTIR